jgi:hypothetical protein
MISIFTTVVEKRSYVRKSDSMIRAAALWRDGGAADRWPSFNCLWIVKQRLWLAAVSAKVLGIYAENDMTLEQLGDPLGRPRRRPPAFRQVPRAHTVRRTIVRSRTPVLRQMPVIHTRPAPSWPGYSRRVAGPLGKARDEPKPHSFLLMRELIAKNDRALEQIQKRLAVETDAERIKVLKRISLSFLSRLYAGQMRGAAHDI